MSQKLRIEVYESNKETFLETQHDCSVAFLGRTNMKQCVPVARMISLLSFNGPLRR